MRITLLLLLTLALAALALAGVFSNILDATITTNGTVAYSKTFFASGNDSTHITFLSSDSLKVYTQLQTLKTPSSAWENWTAVDSIGPAAGVYVKSFKGLTSAHYGYRVKVTVAVLDATSSRVRLRAWETGD